MKEINGEGREDRKKKVKGRVRNGEEESLITVHKGIEIRKEELKGGDKNGVSKGGRR